MALHPLLPGHAPRRVVLYVDSCGFAGCCCIAAIIRGSGGRVIWSDFRECHDSGPGFGPLVLELYPDASKPAEFPDLVFDEAQYITEVQRVSAAREWESDRWRTALLLAEYLHPGHPWSIGQDLYPGWAEPRDANGDGFLVVLWGENEDHGVAVTLAAGPGSPEQRARSMADVLMTTPTDHWPVIRRMRHGRYFGPASN
jgi:hypothetical protein